MLTPAIERSLAELATHYPAASRVFARHGLDYCCGGRTPLLDACAHAGLDASQLVEEIAREEILVGHEGPDWSTRPLPELIAHIVDHFHARLREELPALIAMARKVEGVHGDKAQCPRGLAAHLEHMHSAVLEHLAKEEEILFPMVLAGQGHKAGGPIECMEHEHDEHGANLRRLRELAHDFEPPAPACTTWKSLYLRLAALEAELHEHIHLENNVLHPRALGGQL